MFTKLQEKWGISGWRFFWVMITFAFTGTTAAWITAMITSWLNIQPWSAGFWLLKLGVLLIGYQILLLFYGFIFGQFRFFWKYEKKILQRMGILKKDPPVRIAVFASGKGSNAENLIRYFNHNKRKKHKAVITMIVCNRPGAGVLEVASKHDLPVLMIDKPGFEAGNFNEQILQHADMLVLAGFLWKIPVHLINAYPRRIVNIHPALLPAHGGKGMYGDKVHESVIQSGATESGITIHYVDEHYDTGDIIFTEKCMVEGDAEQLAQSVHQLEYKHYPRVIEKLLSKVKNALNQ